MVRISAKEQPWGRNPLFVLLPSQSDIRDNDEEEKLILPKSLCG